MRPLPAPPHCCSAAPRGRAGWSGRPLRATGAAHAHLFRSRPDLMPPVLTTVHDDARTSAGSLFLAPLSGPGQRGSLILDDSGDPVWFKPSRPQIALNFRAAIYRGKPVLTWWEGKTEHGLGEGTHIILDETYREVARVPAGTGGRPTCTSSCSPRVARHSSRPGSASRWTCRRRRPVERGRRRRRAGARAAERRASSSSGAASTTSRSTSPTRGSRTALRSTTSTSTRSSSTPTATSSSPPATRGRSTRSTAAAAKCIWRLGGKKSDFAMGPGPASRGSTTRATTAAAISCQPLRRRRRAAGRSRTRRRSCSRSTRSGCARRCTGSTSHRPPVLATCSAARSCCRTATCWSAGAARRGCPSTHTTASSSSTRACRSAARTTACCKMPWHGHPTEPPAIAARDARAGARLRQLERRDRGRRVAARDGADRRIAPHRQRRPAGPASRPSCRARRDARYAAVVALDAHGRPLGPVEDRRSSASGVQPAARRQRRSTGSGRTSEPGLARTSSPASRSRRSPSPR